MKENLLKVFRQYLTGALSPQKAALAVSLGVLWGIFPIVGTTTGLCTISGLLSRLNLALINGVNYLLYPLQLLLIIPFMQLGSFVTTIPNLNLPSGVDDLKAFMFDREVSAMSFEVLNTLLNAVVGWALLAPLAAVVAGVATLTVMKNKKQRRIAAVYS